MDEKTLVFCMKWKQNNRDCWINHTKWARAFTVRPSIHGDNSVILSIAKKDIPPGASIHLVQYNQLNPNLPLQVPSLSTYPQDENIEYACHWITFHKLNAYRAILFHAGTAFIGETFCMWKRDRATDVDDFGAHIQKVCSIFDQQNPGIHFPSGTNRGILHYKPQRIDTPKEPRKRRIICTFFDDDLLAVAAGQPAPPQEKGEIDPHYPGKYHFAIASTFFATLNGYDEKYKFVSTLPEHQWRFIRELYELLPLEAHLLPDEPILTIDGGGTDNKQDAGLLKEGADDTIPLYDANKEENVPK